MVTKIELDSRRSAVLQSAWEILGGGIYNSPVFQADLLGVARYPSLGLWLG